MASLSSLTNRVTQLEQEVAALKERLEHRSQKANEWVDELFGVYRNDPAFKEAARLGREYSKSLDRTPMKRKMGRNGHSRH